MNLNQLEYFVVLAQHQHYTKASEQLHISQPSLSKAISNLEKELKVFLFEKQGRNVVLTKQGKEYLEYVQKALEQLKEGQQRMQKSQSLQASNLDLGFVSSLQSWIFTLMQEYGSQTQSTTTFSCYEATSYQLLDLLKQGQLDLAFCSKPEQEENFEFYPIIRQKLVVLVPEKQECWQPVTQLTLQEVCQHPLILHTKNSGMRPIVLRLFEREGLQPSSVSEATEDSMMANMVAMGMGVAIVTMSDTIIKPGVKIIPLQDEFNYRYIYMVNQKNRYLTPAARHFKDYVLACCDQWK